MGERRKFCGNNSIIVTDYFYECLDVNDHQILKGNLRNLVANKLLVQKKINKKQK